MSTRFSAARQPPRHFPTAYLPRSQGRGLASHEEKARRRDAERGSKLLAAAIDQYVERKLTQVRMEELDLLARLERELVRPSMLKEDE